ncbi:hypothetical protein PybrP1_000720 [[Pythium] brassicae (nom. inval.)]|nr:hypothetical protein PybrP1_000720 [[Pythium] brassicae (nom. inval.)]
MSASSSFCSRAASFTSSPRSARPASSSFRSFLPRSAAWPVTYWNQLSDDLSISTLCSPFRMRCFCRMMRSSCSITRCVKCCTSRCRSAARTACFTSRSASRFLRDVWSCSASSTQFPALFMSSVISAFFSSRFVSSSASSLSSASISALYSRMSPSSFAACSISVLSFSMCARMRSSSDWHSWFSFSSCAFSSSSSFWNCTRRRRTSFMNSSRSSTSASPPSCAVRLLLSSTACSSCARTFMSASSRAMYSGVIARAFRASSSAVRQSPLCSSKSLQSFLRSSVSAARLNSSMRCDLACRASWSAKMSVRFRPRSSRASCSSSRASVSFCRSACTTRHSDSYSSSRSVCRCRRCAMLRPRAVISLLTVIRSASIALTFFWRASASSRTNSCSWSYRTSSSWQNSSSRFMLARSLVQCSRSFASFIHSSSTRLPSSSRNAGSFSCILTSWLCSSTRSRGTCSALSVAAWNTPYERTIHSLAMSFDTAGL